MARRSKNLNKNFVENHYKGVFEEELTADDEVYILVDSISPELYSPIIIKTIPKGILATRNVESVSGSRMKINNSRECNSDDQINISHKS